MLGCFSFQCHGEKQNPLVYLAQMVLKFHDRPKLPKFQDLGPVIRKRVSSSHGLNSSPAIGLTSQKGAGGFSFQCHGENYSFFLTISVASKCNNIFSTDGS